MSITAIKDLKLLEEIEDNLDVRDAIEALKEIKIKGTISLEAIEKEWDVTT